MRQILPLLALVFVSGCGPSVDLLTGLRLDEVTTGWLDAGSSNGRHKLVPAVSLALKNQSSAPLPLLQVNAVFRRKGESGEWGTRFAPATGTSGLAPGASTRTLLLASDLGYTGTDPREALLHHALFVDADVDVFAKYNSTQWVRVGRFPIERRLLSAVPR